MKIFRKKLELLYTQRLTSCPWPTPKMSVKCYLLWWLTEMRHPGIISKFTWTRTMKNKIVSNSIWWGVAICPRVSAVVSRWSNLLEEIAEQLHSSRVLLQLWQRYKDYSKQCASTVQQQEERTNELLKAATNKDIADDEVATWIQDCNVRSGTMVFFPACLS